MYVQVFLSIYMSVYLRTCSLLFALLLSRRIYLFIIGINWSKNCSNLLKLNNIEFHFIVLSSSLVACFENLAFCNIQGLPLNLALLYRKYPVIKFAST